MFFYLFNDNLLAFNQIDSLFNSSFRVSSNLSRFLSFATTLVSSAYNIVQRCDTLHMSFMQIINNRGPSIDPCGTPQLIDNTFDSTPL